jgi:dolichol-phosphate mannosyltransferase
MKNYDISVVLPIFNESENVFELFQRLTAALSTISNNYEIIFCADPCTDDTLSKILEYRKLDSRIKLIVMSRRFGQQAATMAGLRAAKGACVVIMDSDLQDPPEFISTLHKKYLEGYDVVHARRKKRLGESKLRLAITHCGYWLINKLSNTSIPRNVGEFKIFSRRMVDSLVQLNEYNIFLKGLVSYVGYKQTIIDYIRDARFAGTPHYSQLWGSIPLSLNGIYCYSNKPLHLISLLGIITALSSLLLVVIFIFLKISGITTISGLTTILVLISFFSGLILFSLGVLGEYVGRMFDEVKGRPQYIIEAEYL